MVSFAPAPLLWLQQGLLAVDKSLVCYASWLSQAMYCLCGLQSGNKLVMYICLHVLHLLTSREHC
jgi:hypothetical protein